MAQARNYLQFSEGTDSAVIEVESHEESQKTIRDPRTGSPKLVHVLELHLSSLNGQPSSATYSVVGDKEYALWSAFLVGNAYRGKRFKVTKTGSGFQRDTTLEILPPSA